MTKSDAQSQHGCLLFIPDRPWALGETREALGRGPLSAAIDGDRLLVRWYGEVELAVRCVDQRQAPLKAPPGAPAWVAAAPGRIEIRIPDLDAALDQANTLMATQMTLQDATGGAMYLTWNGEWMLPDA